MRPVGTARGNAKAVERELRNCRRWLMAIANEDGAEDRDAWSDGVYFAAEHVLERIRFYRKRAGTELPGGER